jgi:hypothetical protein
MTLNKAYRSAKLPSWCNTAERERLIEHMQYLTHEKDKFTRLYNKKLREIRKLKKELAEKEEFIATQREQLEGIIHKHLKEKANMEQSSEIIGESFLKLEGDN